MMLIGFKARNHPQQAVKDEVDDRRTLPSFWRPLHDEYGFTVDAAASHENALLPRYWTRETDGLVQSWRAERVWCNPPYSHIEPWLAKAWAEMLNGACESVVMLLPANRCEQAWWHRHVEPYRDGPLRERIRLTLRFLPNRLRFAWHSSRPRPTKGDRPPFGCALLFWRRVLDAEPITR